VCVCIFVCVCVLPLRQLRLELLDACLLIQNTCMHVKHVLMYHLDCRHVCLVMHHICIAMYVCAPPSTFTTPTHTYLQSHTNTHIATPSNALYMHSNVRMRTS